MHRKDNPYYYKTKDLQSIDNMLKNADQKKINEFIDTISKIAQSQNESYVTQGAFFHVVKMLQEKREFKDRDTIFDQMMVCSALENLDFAISHPNSREKYMMRVFDAISKINDPGLSKMFAPIQNKKITVALLKKLIRSFL